MLTNAIELSTAVEENMIDFAKSGFVDRYPEIVDGLKPVLRRILYAMTSEAHLTDKSGTIKCAKVVGDTIGTFHPHGDTSAYGSLVAAAQNFTINYPLIDGQGNFGSILGDGPAAYRYTECRFSKYGYQCLIKDLNEESVEFVPTFDNRATEPSVLPSAVPNLIINGTYAIAPAAFNTSIPPHNLGEVIDITIALIKDPTISNDTIGDNLLPDFPFGGILVNPEEVREYYKNGTPASIKMVAKYEIDRDKHEIHIYELPYLVDGNTLKNEINTKFPKLKEVGIDDITPGCTENEMDFVITYSKNANPDKLIQLLMQKTRLSATAQLMFTCTLFGKLKVNVTLKEMFTEWIAFRRGVVRKNIMHQMQKIFREMHILEALINSFDKLDQIIAMIRKASSKDEIVQNLINSYKWTVLQANAIASMKLFELSRRSKDELITTHGKLQQEMVRLRASIGSKAIDDAIIAELEAFKSEFARPRRTQIQFGNVQGNVSNLDHDYLIATLTDTKDVNILRLDAVSHGSKRMANIGKTKKIKRVYKYNPHKDYLFAVSNFGYIYKVQDIQEYITISTLDITSWRPVTIDLSPRIGEMLVDIIVIPKALYESGTGYLIAYDSEHMIRKIPISSVPQRFSKTGYQIVKFKGNESVILGKYIPYQKDTLIGYGNSSGYVHVYPLTLLPDATKLTGAVKISSSSLPVFPPSIFDKKDKYYFVLAGGTIVTGDVENVAIRKFGSTPASLHIAGRKQPHMIAIHFGCLPKNGVALIAADGNVYIGSTPPQGCVGSVEL